VCRSEWECAGVCLSARFDVLLYGDGVAWCVGVSECCGTKVRCVYHVYRLPKNTKIAILLR
jgi:hypothetical protein